MVNHARSELRCWKLTPETVGTSLLRAKFLTWNKCHTSHKRNHDHSPVGPEQSSPCSEVPRAFGTLWYAFIFHDEQLVNYLGPRTVSFIKPCHGEPWRRHSTIEPQLNSPAEGFSVLLGTTTTKLRTITVKVSRSIPSPRLDAVLCWQAPDSIHGSSATLSHTWMSKSLRTTSTQAASSWPVDPDTSFDFSVQFSSGYWWPGSQGITVLDFSHFRLCFPTFGAVSPRFPQAQHQPGRG